MKLEPITVKNVKDIQTGERHWLEGLLGHEVQDNQQVFIMLFTPGLEPSEAAREEARAGFRETWDKVQHHMQERGVSDQGFDAAVDEAMNSIRPREP